MYPKMQSYHILCAFKPFLPLSLWPHLERFRFECPSYTWASLPPSASNPFICIYRFIWLLRRLINRIGGIFQTIGLENSISDVDACAENNLIHVAYVRSSSCCQINVERRSVWIVFNGTQFWVCWGHKSMWQRIFNKERHFWWASVYDFLK